ncbi:MAG: AraC family transcriptional regulator [Clostridia bacterium]|nr:AraC family transcriptional regulator [Clostridia bacterium]
MSKYSVPLTYLSANRFETLHNARNNYLDAPRPLYSVAYIKQGCADFICGDRCVEVRAGDVIFVPKGCRYHSLWKGSPQTEFLSCHFDLIPFGEPIGSRNYPLQKIENCEALLPAFENLIAEKQNQFDSLRTVGDFFAILADLFPRMEYDAVFTPNERMIRAVRYLEAHYNSPVSISELASLCHVSPSYFHECFKKEMGVSPIEYKNKITIRHAERILLEHKEMPIEELSERLGFESSIYFRRLFKTVTGKTPREYRKTVNEGI